MSERTRNLIVGAVSVAALVVIVAGLAGRSGPTDPTPQERAYQLEIRLKCPFCVGESLADSQSGVARDLRVLIERRIAEGATDQEIIDEFVANYGESILLDPGGKRWGIALWALPVLLGAVGVYAVVRLRRPAGVPVDSEAGSR